jgi:hemerythrin-like metal-binding protein
MTNITVLDEQHQCLVALINCFFLHKKEYHIERILVPTIETVINFTHLHCITEDMLMKNSDYHDIEEHAEQHERFVRDFAIIASKCRKLKEPDCLLRFLKERWLSHLIEYDLPMTRHLAEFFIGRM